MPEELTNIPQVTSTIITTENKPARKKSSSRKKIQRKKTEESLPLKKPSPKWISAVSNFLLLIAIFTIIFAAHRAVKNSGEKTGVGRQSSAASEEKPVTSDQWTATSEEKTKSQPTTAGDFNEPNETNETNENNDSAEQTRKRIDPYTSGGPLDLDRRDGGRNPWNSGGTKDLDNESARLEYKKHYLSKNDSAKEPANATEPSQ